MDWQALGYAITAFSGAVVALLLAEFLKWIRRPKLSMEIDLSALKDVILQNVVGGSSIKREIRLKIYNKGKSPAEYCEGKIELLDDASGKSLTDPSILHWVRQITPETAFTPITINSYDHEFLAMLICDKMLVQTNPKTTLKIDSHNPSQFQNINVLGTRVTKCKLKVTIFSKNHKPVSKTFSLIWNGTWDGFTANTVQILD
jgi:hypothetical protein